MSFEEKAKCFRDGSRIMDSLWEALEEISVAEDHIVASRGQVGPTSQFGDKVLEHTSDILRGLIDQVTLKSECIPSGKADEIRKKLGSAEIALTSFQLKIAREEIEETIGKIAEYPYSVLS